MLCFPDLSPILKYLKCDISDENSELNYVNNIFNQIYHSYDFLVEKLGDEKMLIVKNNKTVDKLTIHLFHEVKNEKIISSSLKNLIKNKKRVPYDTVNKKDYEKFRNCLSLTIILLTNLLVLD